MKRITFSIDDDLKRKLQERAKADRRSVSNVINLCLERYLPRLEDDIAVLTKYNPGTQPPAS